MIRLVRIAAVSVGIVLAASAAVAQVSPGSSPLTIAKGGTAASTESGARTSLGVPTGTSGHALGFLDAANTYIATQTFSAAAGVAVSVFSSGASANAYSNWQNGTRKWVVGVIADGGCGSGTVYGFYDDTAAGCRGWLAADGGWIFGSSTTSPGTGNINLTGGAVWNNGTAPTGTGAYVRATSPTLVTPALGTPSAAVLTNATGLPVSTGISGLATGIASWLATPSSANLATSVTDETGSGALVFATSPTLVTPVLGVASATSINKLTITSPATSATLTVPDGVTLTGPASSGTAMTLGNTETVTGVKTFGSSGAVGRLKIAGTTSGSTVLDATAVASGTLTLPAATDTLIGRTTTDTLTNKTISALVTTGARDNQGTLKLSAFVSSTQLVANANDYTATDGSNTCSTKLTLRISTNASRNITGLSCGQAEGDIRIIHNVGAFAAVLTNQDAGSTASNRFLFGGDMTLAADTSVTIKYDGVASRWRAITSPGGGGGGGGTVTSATLGAGYGISVTGTNPITTSGTFTPAVGLTTLTNSLGANVGLSNTANYFDGPSVAQGTSGTWAANGTVTIQGGTVGVDAVFCKLWDGTTVVSSLRTDVPGANLVTVISLSGVLTSPSGNIKISCRDSSQVSGLMHFNASGNSKDSTITVVRIQ